MGASDSLKLDLKITSRKRNPFPNTEIFGKSILIEQTTWKGQVCVGLKESLLERQLFGGEEGKKGRHKCSLETKQLKKEARDENLGFCKTGKYF